MGVPDLEHSGLEVNPSRSARRYKRDFGGPAPRAATGSAPPLGNRAREFEDCGLQLGRCTLDQTCGFDRNRSELRDTAHELPSGHTEANRERHDRTQRGIAATIFDGADIVRGETGSLRELLEREPERDATPAHFPSEDAWQGKAISSHSGCRHEPLMVLIFNTMIY